MDQEGQLAVCGDGVGAVTWTRRASWLSEEMGWELRIIGIMRLIIWSTSPQDSGTS